mmetsp:Transcript_13799/g.25862  ORF Transcript_13799/g.25862 Transcript_13799/m.25862 type:complete len:142 (+) Transcript_13799:59-484(+)
MTDTSVQVVGQRTGTGQSPCRSRSSARATPARATHPLYIGATCFPTLSDEPRVDAAYNQDFPPVGEAAKKKGGLTLDEMNRRRKLAKLIKEMEKEKEAISKALEKSERKAKKLQEEVAETLSRIDVQEAKVLTLPPLDAPA